MAQKVCRQCKAIVSDSKCEQCGSTELADNFKGRIVVLNAEQSEIAQHINIKKKGEFAVKIG